MNAIGSRAAASSAEPALPGSVQRFLAQLVNLQDFAREKARVAENPDYYLLSCAHEAESGAPLVSFEVLSGAVFGRRDTLVLANNERLSVRYALLDAGSVLMPIDSDGTVNSAYLTTSEDARRALLRSGALAGIEAAYASGKAERYREDLLSDLDSCGIAVKEAEALCYPILVRVLHPADLRAILRIYARSAVHPARIAFEEALDDARRIAALSDPLDAAGQPTEKALNDFIGLFPHYLQATLIDTENKTANRTCEERVQNAYFVEAFSDLTLTSHAAARAYLGGDAVEMLLRIRLESRRPCDKASLSALFYAAPLLCELKGLPSGLDVRSVLVAGACAAMYTEEEEVRGESASQVVTQLLLKHVRCPKKAGEALVRLVRALLSEAEGTEGLLFPTEEWGVALAEEKIEGQQLALPFDMESSGISEADAKWETRRGARLMRALLEGKAEDGALRDFLQVEK